LADRALKERLLSEGRCFGCGSSNPSGLKLKVHHDPGDPEQITGHFVPHESFIGFPGITHGVVVFTALDCMASWAGMMLVGGPRAIWLLRSARVTYHRPALAGELVNLAARIPKHAEPSEPQLVHNEARNEMGDLLVNGQYKIVPFSSRKFKALLGIDEMPADWAAWLELPETD
jgi:acyl-coenzyme A thioesterase PaaI-like protein